jgi:outer membrane cobalamin receptor
VSVRPLDLFRGTGRRSGAYVQQSFTLASGSIHMAAGMRWDSHSVSSAGVASPYASVSFQPFPATRIQLDWGQYAQFPELSQYFSIFGRPSLLPERATHFEAAIEQRLDQRTRVRLEFYNRQDRDLLARPEFDPRILTNGRIFNPPVNAPILNSQRGYARGGQVFVQRRTANGFTGWISYAYGATRIYDGVLRLWFPSEFDQRHTFNVFGSYRLRPTVNLSARWTYGSGFPIPGFYRLAQGTYFLSQDRDRARVPNYLRADARINKAFVYDKWKLTLFAEVVNLTNRTNRMFDSAGGYNTRTGQASLTFVKLFPILPSAGILLEF